MHNAIKIFLPATMLILLLVSCRNIENRPVIIAVSANARYVAEEFAEVFKEKGIEVKWVFGSSGKLATQIENGAPIDLFISADMYYPRTLFQKGIAQKEPKAYAKGQLVLWTLQKSTTIDLFLEDIKHWEHIAIPNPDLAPYGKAAKEYLLKIGKWDEIQPKLIFGESVAQTNQFILTEGVDCGFTSLSVVLASVNKDKGRWILVPDTLYNPILQGMVVVSRSNEHQNEISFIEDFILSDEGQGILSNYGYLKPEDH